MDLDQLSVGSILPYAADDVAPITQLGWAFCDGTTLRREDFPDLFAVIGYSNGGTKDTFLLPDLRGRFLRGASDTRPPGTIANKSTTANPNFQVTIHRMPVSYSNTYYTGGAGGYYMSDWSDDSPYFEVDSGGDKETRPVNVYMQYIIKTKPKPTLPVAILCPYAGSDATHLDRNVWSVCNGNQYDVAEFPILASILSTRFTPGSSSLGSDMKSHIRLDHIHHAGRYIDATIATITHGHTVPTAQFNVPKLSGIFIRGKDEGSQNDPDANSRALPPDGTTGPVVGSLQAYATKNASSKGFGVKIPHYPVNATIIDNVRGYDNIRDHDYVDESIWSGGAAESRPVNKYVRYYILTSPPTVSDGFPLGGIVAIPGTVPPNPLFWAACDGQRLLIAQYKALYQLLGNTWGPSDGQSFTLPDLRDTFLRATDLTPAGVQDQWGDPDRDKRTSSDGKTSQTGTGSQQDFATGLPQNPFHLPLHIPCDDRDNAAGGGSTHTAHFNFDGVTTTTLGGDAETAPVSLAARFYIKIASAA
ncbi:protein RhiB [Aspergillus udagawae]|nr:protein RhiB [Aspergillus udagawae]